MMHFLPVMRVIVMKVMMNGNSINRTVVKVMMSEKSINIDSDYKNS